MNFSVIESKFSIDFNEYFADEIKRLDVMCNDGLIKMKNQSIEVTGKGRLLIRNICMVFDRYLNKTQSNQRFSKAI